MTTFSVKFSLFLLVSCFIAVFFSIVNAQKLSGTYSPDGSCVSSDTCCCSTGAFTVTSSDDQTTVDVAGPVDGGKGCQNFKQLGASFTVVDQYTATWVVPVYNFKYVAKSSSDYNSITVSRQDVTDNNCINKMVKKSGGMTNTTPSTTTPPASTGSSSGTITVAPRPTETGSGASNANPNGSFKATATPDVIMNQGQTEGLFSIDSSFNIRYGILATQSGNNFYDLWFILEPTSTLFSNSLSGNSVALHFISPTTSNPSTATNGSPINAPMVAQDSSGQSRQWKYANIRVPPGNGLRFSFTFALQGAATDFRDTPTVFFQASGTATSLTTVNAGGTGTTTTTTTTNTSDPWTGSFNVDTSRCTPSNECCCAQGKIVGKSIGSGKVTIQATLDGSNTCGGMKDASGDFSIDPSSSQSASYTYPDFPLTLTAELSADHNTISFKNSMYSCLSYANRDSSLPTNTNTSNNPNNNPNTIPTNVSSRDQVLGEWESNGTCTPTISCCCLKGKMVIDTLQNAIAAGKQIDPKYDINDPNLMYGSGSLDGGQACFRKTEMEGVCTMDLAQMTGTCSMQGIEFKANVINGNQLLITNSMYKDCDSIALKVAGSGPSGNSPSSALTHTVSFAAQIVFGVSTLLLFAVFM